MVKITLITLMSAGIIGTGAHAISPQQVELAAGNLHLTASPAGLETDVKSDPEYAVKLRLKSGRYIAVRF